jgi:threonyl-tRNA synthetase
MPVITLPDGSQRAFDHAVTIADVAASIGAGLAKAALAGKINGELVDTSYLIKEDMCNLVLLPKKTVMV